MNSATALSYLLAGFAGVIVVVYFLLHSVRAVKRLAAPAETPLVEPEAADVGGLGLLIPLFVYLSLLAGDALTWAGGMLAGGSILVLVALWDAWVGLHRRARLAAQIGAAAVAVWFAPTAVTDGWMLTLCVAGGALWSLRLFNRMDRIDGLCAGQCVLFCAAVQLLTLGIPGWVGDMTWLLAGSALGFLVYGWPPARVPVGQAGSAFAGLLVALIAMYLWRSNLLPLVASLILLAGFWFDACYTGCVRILRGHASRPEWGLFATVAATRGARWTNVAYLLFGVCWLLPLAWLTARYVQFGLLWLVLAILPMGVAAELLKAGRPAPDEG